MYNSLHWGKLLLTASDCFRHCGATADKTGLFNCMESYMKPGPTVFCAKNFLYRQNSLTLQAENNEPAGAMSTAEALYAAFEHECSTSDETNHPSESLRSKPTVRASQQDKCPCSATPTKPPTRISAQLSDTH
jgi:hypothetical protein